MRTSPFISVVCLALAAVLLSAQGNADQQLEANILRLYPQRELGGQLDRAYGFSAGYSRTFFAAAPVTLHIGGDIGYTTYGKETWEYPYTVSGTTYFVDLQTNNNILDFGLAAKLSLSRGFLRPYIIARTGFSHFFTETKVIDYDFADPIDTSGIGSVSDTAPYAAFGAGFLVPVYSGASDFDPENHFRMYIDFRFLWWWGGRVEYLTPDSIHYYSGTMTYTTVRTRSDRTTAHAGVLINF